MATDDTLQAVLEEALADSAMVLDGVTVTSAGRRRVVKVVIDTALPSRSEASASGPAPSLSLDQVAEATRIISAALDSSDALGEQSYTLEVTSPGVGRALTTPEHFQRNITRLVEIVGTNGESLTARVVSAGDSEVTLAPSPTTKTSQANTTMPYAAISRAVVLVEFSRPDSLRESGASPDKES